MFTVSKTISKTLRYSALVKTFLAMLLVCNLACSCNDSTNATYGSTDESYIPTNQVRLVYVDSKGNKKSAGIDSVVSSMAYNEAGREIGIRKLYYNSLGYITTRQNEYQNTLGATASDQYVYASIEIDKQPVLVVMRLPGNGVRQDMYTDATGHHFTYYNGGKEQQKYKQVQAVRIEKDSDTLTYYFARGVGMVSVVFNGVTLWECVQ